MVNSPRYFGIGFHKTGTTSLASAVSTLGLKAFHHPYQIYDEYISGKRVFSTLEGYDYASNSIIPSIYKQMDQNYPGAQFILTVRPTDEWLKSVKQHFIDGLTPKMKYGNQSNWLALNKTHHYFEIYEMQYGTHIFNEHLFSQKYEEHNKSVIQYFKNRHQDLLVLDIQDSSVENWQNLCDFLKCSVPNASFPHLRKTICHDS